MSWSKSLLYLFILVCLVPSSSLAQQRNFPYSLGKQDYLLAPMSLGSYAAAKVLGHQRVRNLTLDEIALLQRKDVNAFDRGATYNWNRQADKVSNVLRATLPMTPLVLILPQLKNKQWKHAITLGAMYAEVHFLTYGVTNITKALTGRARPFLYNIAFTPEERFQFQGTVAPKGNTSFFSGHSSTAFAFAVLVSKTYTDIYGKGTWSKVIWISSVSLASATAVCRVAAGEHYPTDVIVGAVVGSAIGLAIPALHKTSQNRLSLSVLPNYLSLRYRL